MVQAMRSQSNKAASKAWGCSLQNVLLLQEDAVVKSMLIDAAGRQYRFVGAYSRLQGQHPSSS